MDGFKKREAWRSDLVSLLGRQRKIAEQKDGDCVTVLWAEQYYGRNAVTDLAMALELHEECQALLAEAERRRPGVKLAAPECRPPLLEYIRVWLEVMEGAVEYIDGFYAPRSKS